MPIRTNRGRAAVYRRLWAWPLRSPKHLAVTALVFAVVATAIGLVMPENPNPNGVRTATGQSNTGQSRGGQANDQGSLGEAGSSTGTPGASSSRRPGVSTTPPAPVPAAPEALAVASAWARAWVNHPAGITNEQWTAQLVPLTTDEFLPQLRTVDPANIPSSAVTGEPRPTKSTARAVEVDIATDGATLHLTVIATRIGWRVSAYDRSG